MGHGSEGTRKDGRNGAGPGSDVQGGGAISTIIWQQDLDVDQGDAQGTVGVPPLGGTMDHRDDDEPLGR